MSNDKGWISIHRQLKQHWLWSDPVKLQWWLDILLSVNTSPVKLNIGNDLVECKRGQTIKSLQTWAAEWKTSKDKVRNFFKLLEKDNMVTLENIKISTRLTVCKYDSYQAKPNGKQTADQRQPNANQTQPHPNNNEDNNDNENNENNILSDIDFFDAFRSIYPGTKRGKEIEFEDFKKKYKSEFSEEFFKKILRAIEAKKKSNTERERTGQFVPEWPHLKTYLNQRRWEEQQPEVKAPIERQYPAGAFQSGPLAGMVM